MRFNPRPREAGDMQQRLSDMLKSVSIHARARRATVFV